MADNKKDKTNKEKLALQVGMQLNEADELFSEETLKSMQMTTTTNKKRNKVKTRVVNENRNCGGGPCNRGSYCSNNSPTPKK